MYVLSVICYKDSVVSPFYLNLLEQIAGQSACIFLEFKVFISTVTVYYENLSVFK